MNFFAVLTSGEKLWRQREKNVNLCHHYLKLWSNNQKQERMWFRFKDRIVNSWSKNLHKRTSHLDLSRSLRSKKVKGDERILGQFKGAFFQKVRFVFQISQSLKTLIPKKLSWAWNLKFPPKSVNNLFKFQAQDSFLEYSQTW